ncbi:unnamed protein product [Cyclocybe aegerita]|uniref:Altered inheritance of mitochondria protein 9, mitochondrial n=1 Tax=Cyclocybe aegerita TaxID=1973307 RepID=A0A8S0W7P7_CYCAE|nr:unnamed protein product [Cyclocybe aegerita]
MPLLRLKFLLQNRALRCSSWLSGSTTPNCSRRYSTAPEFQYEAFFKYTSGRWLHNEKQELAKRYLRFNVDGLKVAVVKAAGANTVLRMKKLGEGEFNKAFLLTLDNGTELVARLPLAKAGPGHLVTASEVATMDYARTRLQIPIPRVLAWSSDADNNGVDSAYIIMEKATGVCLQDVWPSMSLMMKRNVAEKLAELEKQYDIPLSGGYGALYYRRDIDPESSRDLFTDGVRESEFVLGPMTPTSFWRDGKAEMEGVDRGPWDEDPTKYVKAVAQREYDWLDKFKPQNVPETMLAPASLMFPYEEHKSLLQHLMSAAPYLLHSDPALIQPSLVHRDLSDSNIFISQEALEAGRIEFTSFIDWQHSVVNPLYFSARIPAFLKNRYPEVNAAKITQEEIQNILKMPQEQRDAGMSIIQEVLLEDAYCDALREVNPLYYHALNFQTRSLLVAPIACATGTWPDGFLPLQESLINLQQCWDALNAGTH